MVITECAYFRLGKVGWKLELGSVAVIGGTPLSGCGRSVTLQLVLQACACD